MEVGTLLAAVGSPAEVGTLLASAVGSLAVVGTLLAAAETVDPPL